MSDQPATMFTELPPLPVRTFPFNLARYLRLWFALIRFSLIRELSFRTNFLVKIFVEILWLCILLAFYETIFSQTKIVADWTKDQYLFFVGCYFAMNGLIEMLFLDNCNGFADLVRTGNLDFYLVQPIDEQFLVTCRSFDWSCAPNILMGFGVMIFALIGLHLPFSIVQVLLFFLMFGCGAVLAYSFLLLLTSASVWLMRNQSLLEMWWLFATLMRYPKEIFNNGVVATAVGNVFFFVIPIMLVSNVPAGLMVQALFDYRMIGYTILATVIVFLFSRWVFRQAMQRYRSASS